MRRDSKRRLWWILDAGGPLWWLAGVLRSRLDAVEQAIFAMSPARIAPVEIASPSRLSESRSESRRWGMLRKLETIDVGLRTPDRRRARSAVGARHRRVGWLDDLSLGLRQVAAESPRVAG